MGKFEKLKAKLLAGEAMNNFSISDLDTLLQGLGFEHKRSNGSHHFYAHPSINEPVNIQDKAGKAKPYQLRQIRKIVEDNGL